MGFSVWLSRITASAELLMGYARRPTWPRALIGHVELRVTKTDRIREYAKKRDQHPLRDRDFTLPPSVCGAVELPKPPPDGPMLELTRRTHQGRSQRAT